MESNDAFQWCYKAGKLARTIPSYNLAMIYLNRVLCQKRLAIRANRHISLVPGGTDLVNAIKLFNFENNVQPLSGEELNAFLPNFQLDINTNGLIQYGEARRPITEIKEERRTHEVWFCRHGLSVIKIKANILSTPRSQTSSRISDPLLPPENAS